MDVQATVLAAGLFRPRRYRQQHTPGDNNTHLVGEAVPVRLTRLQDAARAF